MKIIGKQALNVALVFLVIGFFWIFFSDELMLILFKNPDQIIRFEIYKGFAFIIAVAIIIYFMVRKKLYEAQMYRKTIERERSNYKALYKNANDAIMILNDQNIYVDCNAKSLEMFQCTKDDFYGKTPFDFSPEFQPGNKKSYDIGIKKIALAMDDKPQFFEWIHKDLAGQRIFYAEISLNKVYLNGREHLQAMVRDISARKEAENQLRKSEEKYRILYENALVGMATLDGNAEKLLECNEKFANIFDFNTTEKCLNEFDINSVNSDKFNISDLLTKFKKIENIELKTTKRTGETIWIEVSAYRNHLTGHIKMVVSDITQRRKMQQSLKESEEKYRLLVENGPSVFWITDKHANTIYISSNVEKVYGFSPEEIYQNRDLWINRIHEQDIEMVTNNFNSLFTENNKYDIIYRIKARKGNWIWLHEVGEKYVNEAGEEVAIGVFTDISETKRAQQKVLFAMINAEERERSRIAKDLHDGVSPVLSAIKLYIQSFNNTKEEELRTNLSQKIGSTIKEVINSIEEISKNISPHILQRFGLIAAVESFTNKINELGKVNLNIESKLSNRLPENIEITFYRITTELINNTLKYAKAQNIKIEYKQENEIVYFNYADDGVGFNIQEVLKNKTGMGIHNMKNRINALNGNFDMKLNENGGINIGISVSIDN